jgi:hypothetical protein
MTVRLPQSGGEMAQSIGALLCVGSLLAWDDAVTIRCEHPASPFARPAPPIVVPRIQTLGIEAVTPDLAEEGAKSAHQHKAAPVKGGGHEHQAPSANGGAGQHHHGAPAKGGEGQHPPAPAKGGAGERQHQPSSTDRGEQQHHH